MNDFDQAARLASKVDPVGFFAWIFPTLTREFVFRDWCDTRTLPFPGEPDRTCDSVANLVDATGADRSLTAVVEYQSRPLRNMAYRLLEYLARYVRELNYPPEWMSRHGVVGVLLNLTGPPQVDTLEWYVPGRPRVGLWLGIEVRTMRDEDAALTLAALASGDLAACLLSWIPLMRGGSESTTIEKWKELASRAPEERKRIYAALALVFADLAECKAEWKRGLEDWNVNESSVVAEWRQQGKVQGAIERSRAYVLQTLRLRFPPVVPEEIAVRIEELTDLDELTQWHAAAVTADSLDAFRHRVGLAKNGAK